MHMDSYVNKKTSSIPAQPGARGVLAGTKAHGILS